MKQTAVRCLCLIVVIFFPVSCWPYQQWRTIYQKITQEPEYFGFYNTMIKSNQIAKLDLNYMPLTVFVPENEAVDDFSGPIPNNLVLYHLGVEMKTLKLLAVSNNTLETAHEDNPPLWITTTSEGYYVNNAKIIQDKSNYVAASKGDPTKNQVLHVIDRVLDPMIYATYSKPTAFTFLQHHYKWKISSLSVMNFLHKIQLHGKEKLYQEKGGHTFFIPIDQKPNDYNKWESIDGHVIDGHVVPNWVLFTRPTQKNFVFETGANGDYIYIVVSLIAKGGKDFVKSYTVLGNSDHKKGEVLTEIVKANIPVANGVVHLIKQPLAVFDRDLRPFPYLSVYYKIASDPNLNLTYHITNRLKIDRLIKNESSTFYTVFAPNNRAWQEFLTYPQEELVKILAKHVVVSDSRWSFAKLALTSKKTQGNVTLNTLSGPLNLTIVKDKEEVIWAGKKNIKLVRSDYECNNGIVHIVDGIFGDKGSMVSNVTTTTENPGFWRTLKDLIE